ncbi:MAG TPA: dsRBD fold-containing protein [Acidimicrobiales bacterium]|nr:dsRBD fold-containing protein [Acidimicrobiales bacterium]
MEAHIGDHVVVEGAKVGLTRRRGEVIEILRGASGDRLRVRWDGDEHETVIAPGSDMRIEAGGTDLMDRLSLRIDVSLTEDADHCEAVARVGMRGREFTGWGRAQRNPTDPEVPVVGEELAVARALSEVSHQLVVAAADSLESALGRPVALHV